MNETTPNDRNQLKPLVLAFHSSFFTIKLSGHGGGEGFSKKGTRVKYHFTGQFAQFLTGMRISFLLSIFPSLSLSHTISIALPFSLFLSLSLSPSTLYIVVHWKGLWHWGVGFNRTVPFMAYFGCTWRLWAFKRGGNVYLFVCVSFVDLMRVIDGWPNEIDDERTQLHNYLIN